MLRRNHSLAGNETTIDMAMAKRVMHYLIKMDYVDENEALTQQFFDDKNDGDIKFPGDLEQYTPDLLAIIDTVYKPIEISNPRVNNVELKLDNDKLAMPEFKALWKQISSKTAYVVDFDIDELVKKSIDSLDHNLHVPRIFFKVETGSMEGIKSKDELKAGTAFKKEESGTYNEHDIAANTSVKYDLVGKLVEETGLIRKAVIQILTGIQEPVFNQFKVNPEEFIIQAAKLINNEKATAIIQHITYDVLDDSYDTDIFTDATIKGKLDVNAMKANKHLFDHVVYDSSNE